MSEAKTPYQSRSEHLKQKYKERIQMFMCTTFGHNVDQHVEELADYFKEQAFLYIAVGFVIGSFVMAFSGGLVITLMQYTGVWP